MLCAEKTLCCFIKVTVVVLVVLGLLWWVPGLFPYLYYLRVPLLSGLLLLTLPLICLYGLPHYLASLFVLNHKWHLTSVFGMSVLASLGIVVMGGVIDINAHERFSADETNFANALLMDKAFWASAIADLVAIALALPTCLFAFNASKGEISDADRQQGAIYGALSAILILVIMQILSTQGSADWLNYLLVSIFSALPISADKGYLVGQDLAPGHLEAAVFFLIATVINLAAFVVFRPNADKNKQFEAPALYYILELILILSCVFSSLTFALDYFRIPTLILFVVFSALIYCLCHVDHFYPLQSAAKLPPEQTDSIAALKARLNKFQSGNEQTLIVVCTSGGGIQAAGWTTKVLTGLQDLFGVQFTHAIGLISAVSGGSVGTLHFLDRFKGGHADHDQLTNIFDASTKDSLGAIGWGLSYPDLWRFIGLPFLKTTPSDRAAAINLRWKSTMQNPDASMHSWTGKVIEGELPIPVFNSTFVEDGRAYRLSPMDLHSASPLLTDFNQLYPNYDIDASSAALLSATFPYVTPITRNSNPNCDDTLPVYHAADGGYFDNFGVVSAVDWLDYVLTNGNTKIKRVLFIEIQAFYEGATSTEPTDLSGCKGWIMAVLGPMLTMAASRNSTQAQRNIQLVKDLIDEWNSKGVRITRHPIQFPKEVSFYEPHQLTGEGYLRTKLKTIANKWLQKKVYTPPLSWKLTKNQKHKIELAWNDIKEEIRRDIEPDWDSIKNKIN